jgi:hypothetical protein
VPGREEKREAKREEKGEKRELSLNENRAHTKNFIEVILLLV